MNYRLLTFTERPDLAEAADELNSSVWPEFMLHDPVAYAYFHYLLEELAEYQFMLLDETDRIIAAAFTIPLVWELSPESLPDTGWDWALERGVLDYKEGRTPNLLSAISAAVALDRQGNGLSAEVVRGMRSIAARHGLKTLVAPVRPNHKYRYPLAPIERYVTWRQPDEAPFDPWLRVHWRSGARIVKVACQSMRIVNTVSAWEKWTGMRFPDSGNYIVPGALSPVTVDLEKDEIRYIEPNVWMVHDLASEGGPPG